MSAPQGLTESNAAYRARLDGKALEVATEQVAAAMVAPTDNNLPPLHVFDGDVEPVTPTKRAIKGKAPRKVTPAPARRAKAAKPAARKTGRKK